MAARASAALTKAEADLNAATHLNRVSCIVYAPMVSMFWKVPHALNLHLGLPFVASMGLHLFVTCTTSLQTVLM